jgi:hypothetical protein
MATAMIAITVVRLLRSTIVSVFTQKVCEIQTINVHANYCSTIGIHLVESPKNSRPESQISVSRHYELTQELLVHWLNFHPTLSLRVG